MNQRAKHFYFVKYQVNNGLRCVVRSAVAFADSDEDAVDKVKQLVQNRYRASYVDKVFICQLLY